MQGFRKGVYIFAGPTLPTAAAKAELNAIYLPPARQGDIYRLVELRAPSVIGLIDGYFSQVPAVWHKEVLWALRNGAHVFGAASMGALRAAELEPFGMRGVGEVFNAYRTGVLPPYETPFEDDDEFAVVHGPADAGYLAVSEALVNVRVTLCEAARAGVIDSACRDTLVATAKSAFYADRTWQWLLGPSSPARIDDVTRARLEAWLPDNAIDAKRRDALEMLREVDRFARTDPPPFNASFRFEPTSQWCIAKQGWDAIEEADGRVLDELRLQPLLYASVWQAAVARALGIVEQMAGFGESSAGSSSDSLPRLALGLGAIEEADAELDESHADTGRLETLWTREQQARKLERDAAELQLSVVQRHMLLELKETGRYGALAERSAAKQAHRQERLSGSGVTTDDLAALSDLQTLQLVDWYFTECLSIEIPDDMDAYLSSLDLDDEDALHRLLFDEHSFRAAAQHHVGESAAEYRTGDE
ncbi:MAG: TfuA-like protein [Gammaproteobacteria bacterium]